MLGTHRNISSRFPERSTIVVSPAVSRSFLLALLGLFVATPWVAAQEQIDDDVDLVVYRARVMDREVTFDQPLVETDGRYVIVHLAENRVFVVEGTEAIWSAPAGTGTGFRLQGQGHRWKFDTPKGLFKVRRKEKDPLWIPPDWYYVEKGIRIPPVESRPGLPGVMGTTAVYLGDGLAIHGTNNPAILLSPDPEKRRVSHGCIRLTNEAARELYHLIDVGTPVLIY